MVLDRVLTFRPDFDIATLYGSAWIGRIRDATRNMGLEVLDLYGERADMENLEESIASFKPKLMFAMGHGSTDAFGGQNNKLVLKACQNDGMLSGVSSYFVSCLLGQELASSIVSKGGMNVMAYIDEFVWVVHPDYSANPLADPYAQPFMRAVVEPSIALLQDGNWSAFYKATKDKFNQGIREWWNVDSPYTMQIIYSLQHDRDSLILLGEETYLAKLEVPPAVHLAPIIIGAIIYALSRNKGRG